MCENKSPNLKDFVGNLKKPMPLSKKLALVLKNNALKLVRLRSCCGNHGRPGC